jgi:uncharacterized protein (TIGR04255 family)
MPVPAALARDTIFECVFEMRFGDGGHPGVADLLPGIVFGKLPGRFTNVVPLPLGQLPKMARDQNPQLRYMPTAGLEGPQNRMMFGEHAVAVSFVKPYAGWTKVKPVILECMNLVLDSMLTGTPERYALKYVNLLREGSSEFDLDQTRVRIELGNFHQRDNGGMLIHAEIERNGCINVVDIATGTRITLPGSAEETGVMISVDTVRPSEQADPRVELPQVLEILHETEKEIFFGLLTESTLQKLGPRYDAKY